jgi:broad specificity phosphatase PhoE
LASKKIYLVRHGETEYNKMGIVQGGTIDAPLNDTGKKQAASFWEAYQSIPFQKIYTSSLQRSFQSVQNFIDKGILWEKNKGLNEISWGDYDGQKIYEDDYYWQVVEAWNNGQVDLRIKGGESPIDVRDRQLAVVERIKNSPEELILICMHGRAMRILLSHFIDNDLTKMDSYEHKNLGLYILELDESGLSILEGNLSDHLYEGGSY